MKDVLVEQGTPPLVVVDYLQKVCAPDHLGEEERVTRVTEGLKDLSIEFECPVIAISASDRAGLEPGTRMRARNMRGSTALAYEADVVLIMSNKTDVVARHHLMYGANNGEHFKDWSVVTIEKNRSGRIRRRGGVPQAPRVRTVRHRRPGSSPRSWSTNASSPSRPPRPDQPRPRRGGQLMPGTLSATSAAGGASMSTSAPKSK